MKEFIPNPTSGLVALYKIDESKTRARRPIVGYFRDSDGELVAAVMDKGGKIVTAASIKGLVSVQWEQTTPIPTHPSDPPNILKDDSLWGRLFGPYWTI